MKKGFWSLVDKSAGLEGCWPWTARADGKGRGRFEFRGRWMSAPRVALILTGEPPASGGLKAVQSCGRPSCCNPAHLSWRTHREAMRRVAELGGAGVHKHPERYRRLNRPGGPRRPVKQPHAEPGIDHRTATRYSTEEERGIARRALQDLQTSRNRIVLVPAPEPHFDGHKVRVVENRNPRWYIEFIGSYWRGPRQLNVKRSRIEKALRRIVSGRVRGNGYEERLVGWLKERQEIPV